MAKSLGRSAKTQCSRRRRFSETAKSHHRYEKKHVRQEIYTHIYIIIARPVGALDGMVSLTFGSPEIFWEVTIHHKRTSATQNERPTRINIPARVTSDLTDTKMAKIAILEMVDLVAVQP